MCSDAFKSVCKFLHDPECCEQITISFVSIYVMRVRAVAITSTIKAFY